MKKRVNNLDLIAIIIFSPQKTLPRCSCHGAVESNLTSVHEVASLIPGLTQWVKDLVLP